MNANKYGALIIALGWTALFATITVFRPLMPVDETRYLTVAWEMMVRGDWLLPTLNFVPYSHKPPLIFWLIHATWEVFGVSVTAARMVIFSAVAILLALIMRLARLMFPGRPDAPVMAALLMCAMPVYLVYGTVIMFDSLLSVFVVASLVAVWQAGQKDCARYWLILGVAMGFGILAKGPVALIYILPAALLAPFWIQDRIVDWRRWYTGLFAAAVIAAAIGLAWSVPAAMEGGALYAERIFYTQSAGRMVDAFDHKEPIWFYLPVLLGFLLPLLMWPALWKAVRTVKADSPTRFLMCWVFSALLFFSTISSKSIHYVIPFLPGIVLWAAGTLSQPGVAHGGKSLRLPLFLMALPSIVILTAAITQTQPGRLELTPANIYTGLAHIALNAALYCWASHDTRRTLRGLAMSSFLVIIVAHVHLGQTFLPRYDLTPVAKELHKYEGRAWASPPKYDGEYGFLSRTDNIFMQIGREEIEWWLRYNPKGIIIGRYTPDTIPEGYNILYEQPFRAGESLVIMELKEWQPRPEASEPAE